MIQRGLKHISTFQKDVLEFVKSKVLKDIPITYIGLHVRVYKHASVYTVMSGGY